MPYRSSTSNGQKPRWQCLCFELLVEESQDRKPTARPRRRVSNHVEHCDGSSPISYIYASTEYQHILQSVSKCKFHCSSPQLTKKKKAIAASAMTGWFPSELTLSRIVIIIMQKLMPAHPNIIVFRRPIRSSANAGRVFPTMNINSTNPAISCAWCRGTLAFSTRTDGMSVSFGQQWVIADRVGRILTVHNEIDLMHMSATLDSKYEYGICNVHH